MNIFTYLFWPNPGNASYENPKVILLLTICSVMILGSFLLKLWNKRQADALKKKLSRSWSRTSFWFGIVGLVLVVSRIEQIQFVAMRIWWLVWILALAAYVCIQIKSWKLRYYKVLPKKKENDPREKYLPKKKL